MSFVSISDLHIRTPDDDASLLCKSFFKESIVLESSTIAFLGDIFDYAVGNHKEFLEYYNFFFEEIKMLVKKGKKIIYIEGNHDFHLESLFRYFWELNDLDKSLLVYTKENIIHVEGKVQLLLAHGDIVDHENISFQRWKRLYQSNAFKFLVDKILTFSFIQKIGKWASSNSKYRGRKTFDKEQAQNKYRKGFESLDPMKATHVLCGHTHVSDLYTRDSDGLIYINAGYPLIDKQFIFCNGETVTFSELRPLLVHV